MKATLVFKKFDNTALKLKDLSLLLLRMILAYGFYEPAMMKVKNVQAIGSWFESLGYPLPLLNAYLATATELLGFVLLLLGLGTRIISIPLQFVMFIAITTVHWQNGFQASANGFEIPLYYLFMLFVLLANGGGKYSLDYLLRKK